jgi:hypothetical protein
LPVRVICVEFDQPMPMRTVWQTVRRLRMADYQLANIEGWNYTFVRRGMGEGVIRGPQPWTGAEVTNAPST